MFSTEDEFKRIKPRACAACGGTAVCHRISHWTMFVAYSFTCTQCNRELEISGITSLIAIAIFAPMFLIAGIAMLGIHESAQLVAFGAGALLGSIAMIALFVSRVRTARRNPKIRVPRAKAIKVTA
ncbi:MAG TPA: hypothetical protein VGM39_17540 [Kofleriaceae bacterium]|jgi:hypothetical protein